MKQWIRWSGLAGFIVIITLLVVFALFAAGPLIKISIETLGSKAAGAKVDVGEVNLMFDPLAIEVVDVTVANSDKPMENLVQFKQALADLELWPLLLGKVLVDNLKLTGLGFSTERKFSGALEKSQANPDEKVNDSNGDKTLVEEGVQGLQQSLPTADELLAREPLLTEQRGKAFQTQFSNSKKAIDDSIKAIPNEQALKQYEVDLNRIVNGRFDSVADFEKRKKEFDSLKKRIKQDKKAIKNASKAIASAKSNLQSQWGQLKSAPQEDFANLKSKYQLDGAGVGNLTRLLFGDQVGEYSKKALYWYEKAKPYLVDDEASSESESLTQEEKSRKEGRFVHFPTDRPLPDFLIANTELQVTLDIGDVDVKISDITRQQRVINRPTKLFATANRLQDGATLKLNGSIDRRMSPGKDRFDLALNGFAVKNQNLGAMGLKLNQARLDIQAKGELSQGVIDAKGTGIFNGANFSTKDSTLVAKEMVAALAKIKRFNIEGQAKGELLKPKLDIKSDLEKQLSSAFNQRLQEKQKQLEKNIQSKLNDKLLSYAGNYQEELKSLDLANGSFSSKEKQLQKLADTKMSSFQKQKEDEAKRKLDQETKKKQKELEKKAKEAFKKLF